MQNRLRSKRGQRATLEPARTAPRRPDNHPDPNNESNDRNCQPARTTETPSTRSFPPSKPLLNVTPVGLGGGDRHRPVELTLDDRLNFNHDRTPFNLARNAE
jgi:hypothetical protein